MIRRITVGFRSLGHILNNTSDRLKYFSRGVMLFLHALLREFPEVNEQILVLTIVS